MQQTFKMRAYDFFLNINMQCVNATTVSNISILTDECIGGLIVVCTGACKRSSKYNTFNQYITMSNLDTAKAFFDSCWKGNGWEKCKDYCAPNAIFRSQAMLFHPPMASESNLGGSLEAYVDWVKVMATKVLPKCYLTDVAYVYDAKTNIAIFSGIFNAKHSKTPRVSQLPPPTKKSVKSDYVYRIHFNAKGKIDSLVKVWNSEWFQRELGWMD